MTCADVLRLELLQALHLVGLEAAELAAPQEVRRLRHLDLANRFACALPLRLQHIDLPKLRDNLLRLVSLPRNPAEC